MVLHLKKIAIVSPAWPLRGGISLFTVRLAQALKKHNIDIHIINFLRQYPSALFPGQSEEMPENKPVYGDRIIDACVPFSWKKAFTSIEKYKPDIVIIAWWHHWFWPCYRYIVSKTLNLKIPIFFLCHNCWPHENSAVSRLMTKDLLSKANGLIFLSKFTKKSWQYQSPSAVSLFHPIYEWPKCPVHPLKTWNKKLLWAGNGRSYKGLDLLISVFEFDNSIKLTVTGDIYDSKVLNLLKDAKNRFQKRLILNLNFCSDYELVSQVDQHDMVVCPYKRASQSGIIALALGRNRPVVVTPAGGLPEQISPKTGIVAKNISSHDLWNAVNQVYAISPKQWFESISMERQTYSWENFIKKLCIFCKAF